VAGEPSSQCQTQGAFIGLTNCAVTKDAQQQQPLSLRPRSRLFAEYQRSVSDVQQAVLARWAAGDFQAGDEQLSAAESEMNETGVEQSVWDDWDPDRLYESGEAKQEDEQAAAHAVLPRPCPHPRILHSRYESKTEAETVSREDAGGESSELDNQTQNDQQMLRGVL